MGAQRKDSGLGGARAGRGVENAKVLAACYLKLGSISGDVHRFFQNGLVHVTVRDSEKN